MSDKKRPRTERRASEREARKLVQARQQLASLARGGAPERPIEVVSSSVIEVRAEGMRCPLCDGPLRVEDHRAPAANLRAVDVRCRLCGVPRTLWFRIAPTVN